MGTTKPKVERFLKNFSFTPRTAFFRVTRSQPLVPLVRIELFERSHEGFVPFRCVTSAFTDVAQPSRLRVLAASRRQFDGHAPGRCWNSQPRRLRYNGSMALSMPLPASPVSQWITIHRSESIHHITTAWSIGCFYASRDEELEQIGGTKTNSTGRRFTLTFGPTSQRRSALDTSPIISKSSILPDLK